MDKTVPKEEPRMNAKATMKDDAAVNEVMGQYKESLMPKKLTIA